MYLFNVFHLSYYFNMCIILFICNPNKIDVYFDKEIDLFNHLFGNYAITISITCAFAFWHSSIDTKY